MKTILDNRWFSVVDLGLVAGCAVLWYVWPQLGVWLLPLALLPWFARLINGRFPFRNTLLDIPMLVFLSMAFVGVWAAYDREMALAKLWLLLSGILLFYALVEQPQANWMLVTGSITLMAAFIAGYFLLVYNWQVQPADLGVLNRLGLWWMKVRPSIQQAQLNPNRAGGILAALLPLIGASIWSAWQCRRKLMLFLSIPCGILAFVALLMTSSRAAWLALGIATALYFLVSRGLNLLSKEGYFGSSFNGRRRAAFIFLSLVVAGLIVGWLISYQNGMIALLDRLPGLQDAGSRMELFRNTFSLIADYPYTGAGLGAFPGIYSRYVMLIPDYLFGYSHNLFLDITLEQGVLGLLAMITIMLGSFWVLFNSHLPTPFHWAVFAGIVVFLLQGLADDPFYANPGTPLLFLLPGMAFMLSESKSGTDPLFARTLFNPATFRKRRSLGFVVLIVGGVALIYIFRAQLLSYWYADLGAVQMARVELNGWSPQNTARNFDSAELASSEALLQHALQLEPQNRSAQYHLGLIALDRQDFNGAVKFLEPGYLAGSRRRGLEKALGYSYAWSGQVELGAGLLANIPEAQKEMGVYSWWWRTQGREDLAQRATQMAALLEEMGTSTNQN